MRVLLVTPSYFPIIGGSEVLTRSLATKLNENGIKADIATFNMDKKWNPKWKEEILKEGPTQVFKIGAFNPFLGLPNPLSNLFRLNVFPKPSFAKRFQDYDLIHFIGEADLSFPILSLMIDRPKIMHCVGIFRRGGIYKYYNVDRPFMGIIFKKLLPKLAEIFVVSSIEEKELLLDMGLPENRIFVLPIGTDTEMFHPDKNMKTDNMLLFVGRIEQIKGLHVLMEALQYIDIPTYVAIIGPRWEETYAGQIEEMASVINKKGFHKVMLLGSMNQKELVKWYQKASVLVCPYIYETYSNVVREALACGTPVVSTGKHILQKGCDGVLVVPKNPKKIAEAIEELLKDKELHREYSRAGRELIEQYFSWDSIVRKLCTIYKAALNS
jgi:glycosyltransferase involved in cell wall biosynthesis